MARALLTPKYLTEEVAKRAVAVAYHAVADNESPIRLDVKGPHCHVVVLVPAMEDARADDFPSYPNYPLRPVVIYEQSFGHTEEWEHEYNNIARCKALQLWTDRNDNQAGVTPHLLFPSDTPFWGGVKREGIVVACSGVQPWFDKLISGIVADTIIALVHDAYERDEEDSDFLS